MMKKCLTWIGRVLAILRAVAPQQKPVLSPRKRTGRLSMAWSACIISVSFAFFLASVTLGQDDDISVTVGVAWPWGDARSCDEWKNHPVYEPEGLSYALEFGKFDWAMCFIEYGIDVNTGGTRAPPLIGVVEALDLDVDRPRAVRVLEALLDYGADVNATDEYGSSALHALLEDRALKKVWGAAPHMTEDDTQHRLPAVLDMLEALLDYGADVNATLPDGRTALHHAVVLHPSLVRVLLDAGADVSMKTHVEGATPLHLAVRARADMTGGYEVVRLLLEAGANPSATDYNGVTPEELLKQR